jgi:hypothetical protein
LFRYIRQYSNSTFKIIVYFTMKTLQFLLLSLLFSNLLSAQNCWEDAKKMPTIQGSSVVCAGKTSTLTAINGSSYQWSTGETTATIDIAPQTHQLYTVTVTHRNGCSEVLTQAISVRSLALKPMQNVDIEKGKSATVGFYATQLQYRWNTDETTPQITVSPSFTSTYTVTASTKNGCSATSEVLVEVLAAMENATIIAATEPIMIEKIIEKTTVAETTAAAFTPKIEVPRTAISMYPNPISGGDATVKVVTNVEDLNTVVIVCDLWGRTMLTQRSELFMGTNYIKINTNNLATGTYLVRIASNSLRFEAQKLVKI